MECPDGGIEAAFSNMIKLLLVHLMTEAVNAAYVRQEKMCTYLHSSSGPHHPFLSPLGEGCFESLLLFCLIPILSTQSLHRMSLKDSIHYVSSDSSTVHVFSGIENDSNVSENLSDHEVDRQVIINNVPGDEMPHIKDAVRLWQGGLHSLMNLATIISNHHFRHGKAQCFMMMPDAYQ